MVDGGRTAVSTAERHLVHSHAHEGSIPGTVNVQVVEGDDTALGQALFPVPPQDPNHCLNWPAWKKQIILFICCAYSFLGNAFLVGPSPYITLYSELFDVTPAQASGLISYPNLAFGFGSLILVPLYLKFGRRPVMLGSMLFFVVGIIGASQANDFTGLMVARVFASFGSGICEAIPVQLVNDIFFLHERGRQIALYSFAICLGAVAPVASSHLLIEPYSWRLFFYVILAFASALLVLAFLFVEETSYDRSAHQATVPAPSGAYHSESGEKASQDNLEHTLEPIPMRTPFMQTLSLKGRYDPEVRFFMTMVTSFTYFLVPQVLWVITSFGIYIGLGAFVFNYTAPIKLTGPPYNWSEESSGLIALATLIGFVLAVPFAPSSDLLAARLTRRNNGIREAEMRLPVMLPAMVIAPLGLVLYGLTCQFNLHYIGYFFGAAMTQWSAYFFFSFALAYAVDSYNTDTAQMLIAMNIGKQAISFGLSVNVLDWVLETGYAVVISGIFAAVLVANNLVLVVFLIWGKKIRQIMAGSWLAKLHGRNVQNERQVV
ncbi:hypothetical protein PFICI_03178 [Pestalotiopsis fici W106-1]|uniref:Major facilitator superfamily (MFS) profile domain-containing protein n=1 Tax=Pestalotiopsis fici (strain W106-1 / CGMCC3.15140) TaxID=1229662 RepID=W3XGD0_PESFW|nr:uncharacterized protein PFICI_03178 [Pestalotiopsis fici W106-1]ETS85153.1 hypothetical protein PFICI_03178 [Pestalotiopsis fici W106-1]